jgi:antitoxin MazE
MAEVLVDIKRWGNNLGVRLPAAVAKAAKLSVDQRVRVSIEEGRVVITPIGGDALTLEQRLALFDPARHGEEVMAARLLGCSGPSVRERSDNAPRGLDSEPPGGRLDRPRPAGGPRDAGPARRATCCVINPKSFDWRVRRASPHLTP